MSENQEDEIKINDVAEYIKEKINMGNHIRKSEELINYFKQEFKKESVFIEKKLLEENINLIGRDDSELFKIKYTRNDLISDIDYFVLKDIIKDAINRMKQYSDKYTAEKIIQYSIENNNINNIPHEDEQQIMEILAKNSSNIIIIDNELYMDFSRPIRDYEVENSRLGLETNIVNEDLNQKMIISIKGNTDKSIIWYDIVISLEPHHNGPDSVIFVHLDLKLKPNAPIKDFIKVYKII